MTSYEGKHNSSRVKILATIGPSSASFDIVKNMIRNNTSGFRMNMAFGDPDTWSNYLKIIREASLQLDTVVSVIGDIPGPQIRSGVFNAFEARKGDVVYFVNNKQTSEKEVPVLYSEFYEILEPGDTILYGDGEVESRALEVDAGRAKCMVTAPGVFKPNKKVIVVGKEYSLPFPSSRDLEVLRYACENEFTYVALSYVRSSRDLSLVKDLLKRYSCDIGLISKIETISSVRNLKEIVELSDAILVARGDLGVHFPIEKLPLIQEQIVVEASTRGRPVIIATDILDSMVEASRPSRSNVIGLYNVVHSLVDAVLLTNETAIGKHPLEAVRWARIILETARRSQSSIVVEEYRKGIKPNTLLEKYVQGLVSLAESLDATILAYTKTGRIAPLISRLRPRVSVYVGSWSRRLLEKYTIYYGIMPVDLSTQLTEQDEYEKGVQELYSKARSKNYITPGEIIVKSYSKPRLNIHEITVETIV